MNEKSCQMGECGEFQFNDDPGAFLFYYRLFESIVSVVQQGNPDAFQEAQTKIIMGLCALAEKIEGKTNDLSIHKVLTIWKIASFTP